MDIGPLRTLGGLIPRWSGGPPRRALERVLAATAALLLVTQLIVVVTRQAPDGPPTTVAIEEPSPTPPTPAPSIPTEPATVPPPEPASDGTPEDAQEAPAVAQPAGEVRQLDPGEGTADTSSARVEPPPPPPPQGDAGEQQGPPPRDPAHERFARDFPDQEAAGQDPRDPATTRWAVLIGINDHYGATRDNVGSRQDAEDLYRHLVDLGWRQDHIVLLTDLTATRERVEQSIAWLARKTDGDSVAVFHYSGHTKQWFGWDPDRDGEVPDEALWPADNDRMTDRELTDRLAQVRAARMWIDIGACEAAGYADPGMLREGRVLTFSSREEEKSYEDPSVSNSVWGYYLVEQAMIGGHGDKNGDGEVTVQEAFEFAAPRAPQRTANGRNGPQHPVIQDQAGTFSLHIPPPPPPPEEPREEPSDDGDEDDGDDCGLPICTVRTRQGRALSW